MWLVAWKHPASGSRRRIASRYLWSFGDDRIAVRFEYEWHDASGQWWRSYGCELWEFAPDGRMRERHASINDVAIKEAERRNL